MNGMTIQRLPDHLDQTLCDQLAAELDCEIELVCEPHLHVSEVVQRVTSDVEPQFVVTGDRARVAVSLPTGNIATWEIEADYGARSARHAAAILKSSETGRTNEQLAAEIDSLTAQVMNDFEELSLIRTLALSMELPPAGVNFSDYVLEALSPITDGVNAQSLVGLFTDEKGRIRLPPIWSGDVLLSDDEVCKLVQQYRQEAESQPVVRNNQRIQSVAASSPLNEFVLVECNSEGRLHGWIVACNRINEDKDVPWAQLGFTTVQASLLETVTNQLAAQLHNLRLLQQKESLFTEVVRALVNAVEARDPYTCGHSERVASFAKCLATLIGQSPAEADRVYLTGLLHDVGKIAIPDGVLQKPGRLDQDERAIIETHTDAGWRILHGLDALQEILPGVLYHHEHFNGKGYPDGLVGENIPIDGRILAVCDAFDAMTSDRPYRKGMEIQKACEILSGGAGKYWDPKLIDAFLTNVDQFDQIRINHEPRAQATRQAPVDGVPIYSHGSAPVGQANQPSV